MESSVKITAPGGGARGTEVLIDGQRVGGLSGVDVSIAVGEPNTVRLNLIATAQEIQIGAEIRIGGAVMPEAVERALLAYLLSKYSEA